MIRTAILCAVFCFPMACQAAPTEREFAQDMLARFQAIRHGGEMRIKDDEPLVIQVKEANGWEEAFINLHRVYGYCLNASREDCESVKEEFVRKTSLRPPEPKREGLRVIVRDQTYMDYLVQTFKDKTSRPLSREIGEGLYAILAVDTPDAIALANAETLSKFGLTEAEAWQLAMQQTKAILPPLPRDQLKKQQGVAFQDFEYLASMLADLEGWKAVAAEAGPDLFVTAVSDNFVFAGLMPDGVSLNDFKRTVDEDCRAQQRCVSPYVYRFRNGRWVVAD